MFQIKAVFFVKRYCVKWKTCLSVCKTYYPRNSNSKTILFMVYIALIPIFLMDEGSKSFQFWLIIQSEDVLCAINQSVLKKNSMVLRAYCTYSVPAARSWLLYQQGRDTTLEQMSKVLLMWILNLALLMYVYESIW